jgi:hypothetical protein
VLVMALYDVVNGVYRKVTKKYDPVDGVYRNVKAAYDPVDGVYRQYFSSGNASAVVAAGTLSVGDTVLANVNGVETEFLVIHQGRPPTKYATNCNGTWLMWKNGYIDSKWQFMDNRYIEGYLIQNLKTMFSGAFDADIESGIKTVNIPFYHPYHGETWTGTNGLQVKFFLLSGVEVGFSARTGLPTGDGVCLDYFNGATNNKRIIPEGQWLLRTASTDNPGQMWFVGSNGAPLAYDPSYDSSVVIRPAFILNDTTQVIKI